MEFPVTRMRRLRRTETLRRMVQETRLSLDNLIMPIFIRWGDSIREPIDSMPGIDRMTPDLAAKECVELYELGIPAVILFGIPESKDEEGTSAFIVNGVIQKGIKAIKATVPEMVVITDVCLCEYTSHGHCGILKGQEVDNDVTIERLAEMALSHAKCGADIVAPSDMMDGRVQAIRFELDENGFEHIPIMSYSAKYSSAFYGPFREAAGSAPQFGNRRSYQMDFHNVREAIREVELDEMEGADIVMVKPALAYLDVIKAVREITDLPLAAYNVSGEYAMIVTAGNAGLIDADGVMMETLIGIKRAGADLIITYFSRRIAELVKKGNLVL